MAPYIWSLSQTQETKKMAIVVEHDKRKQEILQKSLDVFIDEGYEDATFQKIADRCGITRTTLYIYFKNKHEIFLGSIKELLSGLEKSLYSYISDESLSSEQMLKNVLKEIIEDCDKNRKLFSVLLNYLMQLKKSGINPDKRVKRRVIKVRHLISTILIRGIGRNEFIDKNVKNMNELVYGLIESAIFRLAVLNQDDISDVLNTINLAISGFIVQ